MKTIIFTGGGSGGHVIPALTIIQKLKESKKNYQIVYFGSYKGIESTIVPEQVDRYIGISTGKIRRYLSFENVKDIFKIGLGLIQSFIKLLSYSSKDTVIFSTGGFVSVPVVIAGKITGKKVYVHEQTTRMGLANKVSSYFANKVFVSFEESLKFIKGNAFYSGYPVRSECFDHQLRVKTFKHIDLSTIDKPLFFITGGGNGSLLINERIKEVLDELKEQYVVIHQVGKNFLKEYESFNDESYLALDFVQEGMIDLFKKAEVILSRAGAGTVCELMALKKKSIFIPLKIAQKNEQYHNAMAAKELCGSVVCTEDELQNKSLTALIEELKVSQDKGYGSGVKDGLEYLKNEIEAVLE
ncbi:UDP-N-acetylglucosamine--N-acetylmuramyl-(pentapeptide) pyrophosphoryl-undecaprenol N-acetylglucosamine transferase [Halobacteriovorax sp. GB3]|uniref:UDP-N-acetylglucosamine--N-acetylmuramyl- (pentapeptide) pyrophosphoryl-undecaprenol N-acetylglucosamine transferase n=1 Tax=Halobacteriovorax sp. GB3 TaxID=2719615 RepID=UPI002360BBB1|nr:UDP-N-acetylglucosamine--N-acetylmuramyl-(pentapeptide) pyrophosphoryl-undecaprenol N-acetylglucosamine transferase [Halobacteriovorax sp. GB3]MDD0854173.1 UDP-N-acetylglucosamine--N-acetylmuramyl-(pentapeptide) pyrophosphoryl-undecaprenol N-acetylglucosamine transferase [Halobacteriovorax sp. GB3]